MGFFTKLRKGLFGSLGFEKRKERDSIKLVL